MLHCRRTLSCRGALKSVTGCWTYSSTRPSGWPVFILTEELNTLITMSKSKFMFATGIENSYPTIQLPDGSTHRVDEMAKTSHYQRWQEDFALLHELGIEFLRYGPPLYSTHIGPDRYDWDFSDATFGRLKEMKITPIVD